MQSEVKSFMTLLFVVSAVLHTGQSVAPFQNSVETSLLWRLTRLIFTRVLRYNILELYVLRRHGSDVST